MPEPIRILRVIARLNMGGPAIHVSNLAAGLETRGYHTTLVAGSLARGEDSMAFVAERLGVKVVDVPEIQREVAQLHDARSIRRLGRTSRLGRTGADTPAPSRDEMFRRPMPPLPARPSDETTAHRSNSPRTQR